MVTPHPLLPLIRFFYKHFYNRFAFTYDPVSRLVSRGEWSSWTHAAMNFLAAPDPPANRPVRVLEIAFGTGNLLLNLAEAGYSTAGVDLSPYMIEIARRKLSRRGLTILIVRAAVQQLPFSTAHFDHAVMTFPPGFAADPRTMREIWRVLTDKGSLIWVDAPYLLSRDTWSRFLNWAFSVTGTAPRASTDEALEPTTVDAATPNPFAVNKLLPRDGWSWSIHRIERQASRVHVFVGSKKPATG